MDIAPSSRTGPDDKPVRPRRFADLGLALALALLGSTSALPAQLAGTYSINPAQPASATNFTSLQAAVAALGAAGVGGPVTFEVYDDAGPYTETRPFTTTNVNWSLLPPNAPGTPQPPATAVLVLGQWAGVSPQNRVTFRAAPGEAPVLEAAGRSMGVFWNGADYVTLEGFEVRNAVYDAINIYSEAQHGQVFDPIIRRCRLHDCGGSGVVLHGNIPPVQNALIENCFFWGLQATNAGGFNTISRFGYVSWRRQNGLRIRNNSFLVSTAAGNLFSVIGGIPGSTTETPCAEIVNNAILKTVNPSRGLFMFLDIGPVSGIPLVQDRNCVLDLAGAPFAFHGPTMNLVAQTLGDWRTAAGRDLTSIPADPLFGAPATGDLHVLLGSPVIDAGLAPAAPPDDIDGQLRSGLVDIGADERPAPGTAQVTTVGTGSLASSGLPGRLATAQVPFLGNTGFTVLVSQALPYSLAYLFGSAGVETTPLALAPGTLLYLNVPSMLQLCAAGISPLGPVPTGPSGIGTFALAIANAPALAGARIGLQAAVLDPLAPFGLALTNALELVVN